MHSGDCNKMYPSGYGKISFTGNTAFTVWWTNWYCSSVCRFFIICNWPTILMFFIGLSLHQVGIFTWMKIFLKTGFVGFYSFSELSCDNTNAKVDKAKKFMKRWSQYGKIVSLRAENKYTIAAMDTGNLVCHLFSEDWGQLKSKW